MTLAGSNAYRGLDRAARHREVDRTGWAGSQLVLTTWDTIGSGTILTDLIPFGTVFEGQPFFSFGVELQEEETLTEADYPFVTCGVQEWQRTAESALQRAERFYTGATIWIAVSSFRQYRLRYRFAFEGTAMRNREHIG
jgi:hypothetical protein